MRVHNWS